MADQAGNVSQIDLSKLKNTSIKLANTPDEGVTFWRDIPASTFTVTDLDFHDGHLYVSGLSTGEFASTLRKIPYPFKGVSKTTSVAIYHAVHNQTETRAPIRAMTIADLGGEPTVVAAYTCTPLVTFPVASLKDGAKVTGKTVAELGYGNTPLDVFQFSSMNMQTKQPEQFVLVVNRERAADLIRMEDLVAANKAEGLSTARTVRACRCALTTDSARRCHASLRSGHTISGNFETQPDDGTSRPRFVPQRSVSAA